MHLTFVYDEPLPCSRQDRANLDKSKLWDIFMRSEVIILLPLSQVCFCFFSHFFPLRTLHLFLHVNLKSAS